METENKNQLSDYSNVKPYESIMNKYGFEYFQKEGAHTMFLKGEIKVGLCVTCHSIYNNGQRVRWTRSTNDLIKILDTYK